MNRSYTLLCSFFALATAGKQRFAVMDSAMANDTKAS